MKAALIQFGIGLLISLGLAALMTLATGCASEGPQVFLDSKVDSTLTAAGLHPLGSRVGKVVFRGPVTLQIGQGNTSVAVGKDKTGQHAQALSTGAHSPVTATKAGGTPWWVFAGVLVVGLAGGTWLGTQLGAVSWLAPLKRLV